MNEEEKSPDFDFDHRSGITRQEPEQFELMRQQAGNPMVACLQISQKMWGNVLGENGLLQVLQLPEEILSTLGKALSGKVLSFERPQSSK